MKRLAESQHLSKEDERWGVIVAAHLGKHPKGHRTTSMRFEIQISNFVKQRVLGPYLPFRCSLYIREALVNTWKQRVWVNANVAQEKKYFLIGWHHLLQCRLNTSACLFFSPLSPKSSTLLDKLTRLEFSWSSLQSICHRSKENRKQARNHRNQKKNQNLQIAKKNKRPWWTLRQLPAGPFPSVSSAMPALERAFKIKWAWLNLSLNSFISNQTFIAFLPTGKTTTGTL